MGAANDFMVLRLIKQDDDALASELSRLKIPLAKFTGHVNKQLARKKRHELLRERSTIQRLLLRALGQMQPERQTLKDAEEEESPTEKASNDRMQNGSKPNH